MSDRPECPICGRPMYFNARGGVGDPVFVCPTDDPAHAAERRRVRDACAALIAARKPDAPDLDQLRQLGATSNPRGPKP